MFCVQLDRRSRTRPPWPLSSTVTLESDPQSNQENSYYLRQTCNPGYVFFTYFIPNTTSRRLSLSTLSLSTGADPQAQPVRVGGPRRHGGQFRFGFRCHGWHDVGYGRRSDRTHVGGNYSGEGEEETKIHSRQLRTETNRLPGVLGFPDFHLETGPHTKRLSRQGQLRDVLEA